MWQVVTAQREHNLAAAHNSNVSGAEMDALIEALAELRPVFPVRNVNHNSGAVTTNKTLAGSTAKTLAPKISAVTAAQPQAAALRSRLPQRLINNLEIPRRVDAPTGNAVPAEMRTPLLQLRSTVMLAAELHGLRSVLLCGADAVASDPTITANLCQVLAEYERLKIAYIDVREDLLPERGQGNLPIGYTFQIRRTRQANLSEIASSLGAVRLSDWLRWWNPAIVMQEMRKMFDLVIVHAPPPTTHPDVALLAAAVDGVVLVATENVTPYATIEAAKKQLQTVQAKILGVTMNQAKTVTPLAGVKARVRELIGVIKRSK